MPVMDPERRGLRCSDGPWGGVARGVRRRRWVSLSPCWPRFDNAHTKWSIRLPVTTFITTDRGFITNLSTFIRKDRWEGSECTKVTEKSQSAKKLGSRDLAAESL